MRDLILIALQPTAEQIANYQYFSVLILAITAAFFAFAWILDRGIDHVMARWNRPKVNNIVDFSERRKLNAVIALRENH